MREVRVVFREIDPPRDTGRLGLGLDTRELDALAARDFFDSGQAPQEVEVPPGAAGLAVGDGGEPDGLLLGDELGDLGILDGREFGRADFALVATCARVLERLAAQERADHIGAKRGVRCHWLSPVGRVRLW